MTNINAQDCLYEKYNGLIKAARENVNEGKIKPACDFYRQAFSRIEFPSGRDLYIALNFSEKAKDKALMKHICIQLAKGGIPQAFFKKYASEKWFPKFSEDFKDYSAYHQKRIKPGFLSELKALEKYDKEVNEHFHEWRTRKMEHSFDSLIVQMKNVSIRFQDLIEKYGFPNEAETGYYYGKNQVLELPTFVLLIHIYQRGELLYKEKLNQYGCDGSLTPSQANQLRTTRGLGNSTGVKQEMASRQEKFRKKNK